MAFANIKREAFPRQKLLIWQLIPEGKQPALCFQQEHHAVVQVKDHVIRLFLLSTERSCQRLLQQSRICLSYRSLSLFQKTISGSVSMKHFQTVHLNFSLPPDLSSFPTRSKYHHLFSIVLTHDKPWISRIINKSSPSQEATSKIIRLLLPGSDIPAQANAHFPT